MNLNITHDKENQRFFAIIENKESELKYKKMDGQTLDFYTTLVPDELRGAGIAGLITDYALKYAKDNHYQVVASCPYVKNYITTHPEYQSLLNNKARAASNTNKSSLTKYWPLISLIIVSLLAALALNLKADGNMRTWMHYFMGIFLVIFSTLKIFHPTNFADGFAMYDIIAKRSRIYAYCYPLIELFLGLAFLSFFFPILTYLTTIIILTIGSVGVVQALKKGLDIKCPCMGTILDVPLSTVTLTEDIVMVLMALLLLMRDVFPGLGI